jgi:transposase-like protein
MSRGPDLARREVWRRRLRDFDRGRATVAEFCRREGVSDAAFYQWRRKLASPAAQPSTAVTAAEKVSALSFLPIEITGRDDQSARIEVVFPNGTRVLVPGRDQATLSAVLRALAGSSREAGSC